MNKSLILGFFIFLSGCMATAPTKPEMKWTHKAKNAQQFHADKAVCLTMAKPTASQTTVINNNTQSFSLRPVYNPYTPPNAGFASGLSAGLNSFNNGSVVAANNRRRQETASYEIASSCMKGKGWYQVTVAPEKNKVPMNRMQL